MRNTSKSVSLILLLSCCLFALPVLAQPDLGLEDLGQVKSVAEIGNADLITVIGNVIKIVLSLMGMIAVIFLIVGGFMWMTSAGNEEKIKKAKGLMGASVIGIVIILIAYAAAKFIIIQLSTVTVAS
ncbi:hypothetical protein ISS06_01230 [Patescibacteria group bacterium]|nr:hypothetical protein [Patescibacteria group bacterium]